MKEIDVFARLVREYGPPRHAEKVSSATVEAFRDRLPKEMIDFWLTYGWGEYKKGSFRICDPRPFDPILEAIFKGDAEFHAADLTLVAYTVFNRLKVWQRIGRTMLIDLERSDVTAQPSTATINPDTKEKLSEGLLIGLLIYNVMGQDMEYFNSASEKLGVLARDEVFGFAPALQLGGNDDLDHVHRFKAVEHMTFLAQLGPLKLVELSPPLPGAPLGRIRQVRLIGPQQ